MQVEPDELGSSGNKRRSEAALKTRMANTALICLWHVGPETFFNTSIFGAHAQYNMLYVMRQVGPVFRPTLTVQ